MKEKHQKLITIIIIFLQFNCLFISCQDINPSGYILELPKAPDSWVSLLGDPCWRIEWISSDNKKQIANIPPHGSLEIEIPATWANPVTAWPYWPGQNLIPGFFKPAGAIFPFDAKDSHLYLSWEAGPDTIFYWELLNANEDKNSRVPANFDWPRFRELFNTDKLKEEVREDPWLINWRSVAEKTVSGNFDTRRLVPEVVVKINIPITSSLWYGTSPFTKPLSFKEGEPSIFPIRPGINVWISDDGILRVDGKTWVFTEMRNDD
ncbi:MAG: hypothetical protein LBG94_11315 [Treponema sp.]|jgi:hypothetical protein|nr:hypothetical protein [Treponema sp.]